MKADFALNDAGYVEQVVHQAGKMIHLTIDDIARTTDPLLFRFQSSHDLNGVSNRGERIPEFVAQHREKLVLAAIGVPQGLFGTGELLGALSYPLFQLFARLLQFALHPFLFRNLDCQRLIDSLLTIPRRSEIAHKIKVVESKPQGFRYSCMQALGNHPHQACEEQQRGPHRKMDVPAVAEDPYRIRKQRRQEKDQKRWGTKTRLTSLPQPFPKHET